MSKLPLSKGALVILTLCAYSIFVIVVTYGWWTLIVRPSSEPAYTFLQAILVGVIVVFASFIIRAIALLRAQRGPVYQWVGYWLAVLLVTAAGTVGGAFNWLESKAILRDDIAMVQGRFDTIAQKAGETLGGNRYQLERQMLTEYLKELEQEINESTGLKCGFGTKAAEALAKINGIVHVARTSASVPLKPCSREVAQLMYEPYPTRTWQAFDSKWKQPGSSERRKEEALRKIADDRDARKGELDRLAVLADGYGSAEGIGKEPLLRARSTYNADIDTLAEFVPAVNEDPGRIGALQSSDTDSYAAAFQLLVGRLNVLRTWIYVLVAIFIDFVLISLLTEMTRRYANSKKSNSYSSEERLLLIKFERDPRFLWRFFSNHRQVIR